MKDSLPDQQETQEQIPQPPKKGFLKALVLLEVGLFEFLFVGIVLVLFFGILNYFNILRISSVFPNQLGWLPHKPYQQSTSIVLPSPQPIKPQAPSYSPNVFQYDTQKATTILTKYIKDTIKPEFLPSKIEVKQNLISSGKQDGTDYEFGSNWKLKDIVFNATLHYLSQTNYLRDEEFYINPAGIASFTVNNTNSEALARTYLNNIPDSINFDCGVYQQTTSFCEHLETKDTGKNGFGVVSGKDESNKNTLFIFSCFIPKNDSYYPKRTSCLLFREKDSKGL